MQMPYGQYNPTPMAGYPQQQYYQQPMQDQLGMLRAQQMPQPAQPSAGSLIWVQGEAGARGYLVAPGNNVMLMDSERNTFYLKAADASGMPSMRIFDYVERTSAPAPQQQGSGDYVTRAEFEALTERLNALTQFSAKESE